MTETTHHTRFIVGLFSQLSSEAVGELSAERVEFRTRRAEAAARGGEDVPERTGSAETDRKVGAAGAGELTGSAGSVAEKVTWETGKTDSGGGFTA